MWELLTRRHPFDHLGSVMNEVNIGKYLESVKKIIITHPHPPKIIITKIKIISKIKVKVRQKVPSEDPDNRPPIPENGPKQYCELIKKCWGGEPGSRPGMGEVCSRGLLWLVGGGFCCCSSPYK